MNTKSIIALLLVISTGITTTVNAQSIYKKRTDNSTDTNPSTYKSASGTYGSYKFDKKNSIKANLISPFFNVLTVFYTNYLDQERAFQVGVSLMTDFKYSGSNGSGGEDRKLNGQALTLEYRYNLSGNHSNSRYIQPFTRIINANFDAHYTNTSYYFDPVTNQYVNANKNINYNESCLSAGLGFLLGVQNTIKNKLVLDLYAGPVYSFEVTTSSTRPAGVSEYSNRGGLQDILLKGYGIRAGLCLGFLF